jgi:hypothetical protein
LRYEDERRPIVRSRGEEGAECRRDSNNEVTFSFVHEFTNETSPHSLPNKLNVIMQIGADHLGEMIFEAIFVNVGEGEIVWIGANVKERLLCHGGRRKTKN